MAFISTPGPEAGDATAAMYVSAEESYGYLPNMYRIFGHRPEVMEKWGALLASIRGHMSLRRYELVTLAAARELKSSYCMLAHGSVLLREGFSDTQLADTATDGAHAPLDEAEREMMRFAAKVVRDATSITKEDVGKLKAQGFSDAEIFDITSAAAVRCFFSKTLDALGAEPDAAYRDRLSPALVKALAVGRPVEGSFQTATATP
ncbi:Carboxymuconolactone decarboxylase [Pseudorhizobium banfieldiae]|uniref:Carboxymuconolactone decarboxylase n=1 Tax=Pseudorhizobium banfieldiae TaxID=1125847 RepID=L0NCR4_9HYPH|nr:carboxymuconolactone decarboxylase family protein [Pseudorhizobium banfieldiae]CAD6603015.1 peroxidase [arsenite-oxidising bacterium NT-25]CCF18596.1 Carboxymuconolactone decarboxylase [Pseudorhizobium banfieldiae]